MKSVAVNSSQVSIIPAVLAAAIALCLVAFAMPARAASLSQEQLSNVQQLLSSYGVEQAKINAVSAVLSDRGVAADKMASSSPCLAPARALVRGMRSKDVTVLQQRLADDGYLQDDEVSGFFGSTTENALKQWQADQGVVSGGTAETTGWGAVGAKTRDALAKCPVRQIEQEGGSASSTAPMRERREHNQPFFPGGSGTPVPGGAQNEQSSVGSVVQFAVDYSNSFNDNMAAVVAAPYGLVVGAISNFFTSIGIE